LALACSGTSSFAVEDHRIPIRNVEMKPEPDCRKALAALKADIDNLRLIDDELSAFNIFEVLRVQRRELQHSNFLAYLLDPTARNGLGVTFLKLFLDAVVKQPGSKLSERAISGWDLKGSYVIREWENKDILIRNRNFICVIENKIGSKQRNGQLKRYRDRIERDYPERRKLFVFLTPHKGEKPDDKEWTPLGYSEILDLIGKLLRHQRILDPSQQSVIEQYQEVLRRHVVKDNTDLVKEARDLYQKHQRAFDFIFENKPSYVTSLHEHLRGFISGHKELRLDDCEEKKYFRFVPVEWDTILSLKTKMKGSVGQVVEKQ